jgi:hypothetical protein
MVTLLFQPRLWTEAGRARHRDRRRSGGTERFGRPVETTGVGAAQRGGRLYGRRSHKWDRNDSIFGENSQSGVADRIVAVEGMPCAVAMVTAVGVPVRLVMIGGDRQC